MAETINYRAKSTKELVILLVGSHNTLIDEVKKINGCVRNHEERTLFLEGVYKIAKAEKEFEAAAIAAQATAKGRRIRFWGVIVIPCILGLGGGLFACSQVFHWF